MTPGIGLITLLSALSVSLRLARLSRAAGGREIWYLQLVADVDWGQADNLETKKRDDSSIFLPLMALCVAQL